MAWVTSLDLTPHCSTPGGLEGESLQQTTTSELDTGEMNGQGCWLSYVDACDGEKL